MNNTIQSVDIRAADVRAAAGVGNDASEKIKNG
jgi:hypothetical protein